LSTDIFESEVNEIYEILRRHLTQYGAQEYAKKVLIAPPLPSAGGLKVEVYVAHHDNMYESYE
jgi:hypothetical protein